MKIHTKKQAESILLKGNQHYKKGQLDAAMECYAALIEAYPNYVSAFYNCALISEKRKQWTQASLYYTRYLELKPHHAPAHVTLADIYRYQGRLSQSLKHYRLALGYAPGNGLASYGIGRVLLIRKEAQEALQFLLHAETHMPKSPAIHYYLGYAYRLCHQTENAIKNFQETLRLDPEDTFFGAQLELANLGVLPPPKRTPKTYMQRFYAGKAETWDGTKGGAYQGHTMITQLITPYLPSGKPIGTMIDLGCGTGILGEHLRSHVNRLEGVDLSPEMLRQAREKKIYDQLERQDLMTFLTQKKSSCQLVVAGAVLIHFSDLREIFKAVHESLKKKGFFVFTVFPSKKMDYEINPFKCYAHHPDYIQRVAEETGFTQLKSQRGIHEYHGKDPIEALAILLQKKSTVS